MSDLDAQAKFLHAEVQYIQPESVLVKATAEYIPIDEFKEVFDYAGNLVERLPIKRLIFDKRSLRIFDQPSMEWYFVEWKSKMAELGLTIHRKILPDDFTFRESVKVGRRNIARKFPEARYRDLDIGYSSSLEEALQS